MISVKDRSLLDAHELASMEHEIDDAIEKGHVYKREYEKATLFNINIVRIHSVLFKYIEDGGWNYIYYKYDDRVYRNNDSVDVLFSEKPLFMEEDDFNFYIKDYRLICRDGDDTSNWDKGVIKSFEDYIKILEGMENNEK